MATIEERFQLIEQSVTAQAEEDAQKLRDQAKELKESALSKAKEEVARELGSRERDETAEIRLGAARSVAQRENQERRELLLCREGITRRVFDAVKKRLADYVKTPDYSRFLADTAKDLSQKCPGTGTVVMLRHDDLSHGKELGGYFGPDVRVIGDETIRLGGIRVMNESLGLFLDESLDSRLEDQKSWFYSSSGLTV